MKQFIELTDEKYGPISININFICSAETHKDGCKINVSANNNLIVYITKESYEKVTELLSKSK